MAGGLARGPLTQHLQAMQDIVNTLNSQAQLDMGSLVEAHWHHAQTIARYTAADPMQDITTRPPDALTVVLDDAAVSVLINAARANGANHAADILASARQDRTLRNKQGETSG